MILIPTTRHTHHGDTGDSIADVAASFGVTPNQVTQILKEVKANPESVTDGKALIAMYEKRYAEAAITFHAEGDADARALVEHRRLEGINLYRLKRYKGAERAFDQALLVDPDNDELLEVAAWNEHRLGNNIAAKQEMRQALQVAKNDNERESELSLSFAQILDENREHVAAQGMYKQAFDLVSSSENVGEIDDYAEPLEELAMFYERHGQYHEAINAYVRLIEGEYHPREFPKINISLIRAVARIWKKQGKTVTARALFYYIFDDAEDMPPEDRRSIIADINASLQSNPL